MRYVWLHSSFAKLKYGLMPEKLSLSSFLMLCFCCLDWNLNNQVVRSRLQEQGQARNTEVRYAGVIDCVNKVFRKEGLTGFYRGCATNLLRTTPSAVITFTSYEMIRRFLERVIPPDNKHWQLHQGYVKVSAGQWMHWRRLWHQLVAIIKPNWLTADSYWLIFCPLYR